MLNTDDLTNAWVALLQNTPDLMKSLGISGTVEAYLDSFPDQDGQGSNLRRAILNQPLGSILAVFMGSDKVRLGNGGAWAFRHRFSFMVRAANGGSSYAGIWSAFVNGIPSGASLPLLHTEIDPGCDAMDREGPSSQRQSLLISMDGETLDYFEFSASLIEKQG